jgi:hypothetical protein
MVLGIANGIPVIDVDSERFTIPPPTAAAVDVYDDDHEPPTLREPKTEYSPVTLRRA